MKITKHVLLILMMAVMGVAFTACDDDDENNSQNPQIVGKWTLVSAYVDEAANNAATNKITDPAKFAATEVTFAGSGSFTMVKNGETLTGTWANGGSVIAVKYENGAYETWQIRTLNGNKFDMAIVTSTAFTVDSKNLIYVDYNRAQ